MPFLGCLDHIFWEENRLWGSGCFDAPPSSTLSLPGFCPVGGKTAQGKAKSGEVELTMESLLFEQDIMYVLWKIMYTM